MAIDILKNKNPAYYYIQLICLSWREYLLPSVQHEECLYSEEENLTSFKLICCHGQVLICVLKPIQVVCVYKCLYISHTTITKQHM